MDLQHWEHVAIGASIVIIALAGIGINGHILISYFKKDKDSFRNPLQLNNVLTNLGIIFFAFPLSSAAGLRNEWFWGDGWCTYYGSISLFFGFGMMMNALMLSIDLYLNHCSTAYDAQKKKIRTIMISWTWINSIFWSVAPLVGWSRISYEPSKISCTVDLMNPDAGYRSYIILCFVFCYAFPLIAFTYFIANKSISKSLSPTTGRKVMIKIAKVTIVFLIEWTPYSIVYLWPLFDDPANIPIRLSAVAPVFAKLAVLSTPLLFKDEYKLDKLKYKD